MAIAIDQLSIGSSANDTASSAIAFTTSATVASGGFIVLCVGWFSSGGSNLSSVSGGSLTWTSDKQGANGTYNSAVVSAQAPSGLASGTTITATLSASADGARGIAGSSFTGVQTSSPVDGTPPASNSFTSTTAWASASATLTAGSLLVATAHQATTNLTSAPTSPAVEMFDINGGAGTFSQTGAYRIESSAGSYTVAGTWSGSTSGVVNAVAYLAAAGGSAPIVSPLVISSATSYAAHRAASI